ncbi:MAG: hypothetical protein A3J30_00945 [Candidatus Wildermuthbacteria bacterium RIFCSPLOWO2_02_FULL_47_9c]|uniref:Uncharacterized protein n=1 Tax=Candidatus Wildermuthbacteria bacterium RIFCSPLOWO2_02_FULL_47_9c TaxID=1802466 RepID=A0A1G2RZE8_9BACT|nr:MAG: hypothetical protein A2109_03010 [Candidatus Wildermuthbacteria bacterium GWA1_49_26]OHA74513.1 MAG: hypothetical protein A3B28_00115 [Candidatus Wildermuthbacteria bacterium RIFCSPLOWO2_01_FULL_50_46]OHA77682.1 MAG: hypothetical protein A3J30_00945 [Candidatus Wildermuthbacteria bacterium RIFCSPLOWO2_02_FULL_47_9c]
MKGNQGLTEKHTLRSPRFLFGAEYAMVMKLDLLGKEEICITGGRIFILETRCTPVKSCSFGA